MSITSATNYALFRAFRWGLKSLNALLATWGERARATDIDAHLRQVLRSARDYDMTAARSESYFRDQYLSCITPSITLPARVLDLGCGSGRILFEIARLNREGYNHGVDISPEALTQLNRQLSELGEGHRIESSQADLMEFLKAQEEGSWDVIVCLEVFYMLFNYEDFLRECCRTLRPGGTLCISIRPAFYYLQSCCLGKRYDLLETVCSHNSGALFSDSTRLNWWDSSSFSSLLAENGFGGISCMGIGCLSGIEGDPGALLAEPGLLEEHERAMVCQAERSVGTVIPDAGRYVLFIARKTKTLEAT